MRINLLKESTIKEFVKVYPGSRIPFDVWLHRIKDASWRTPEDILKSYGTADLLGNGTDRVVFNIGGNNYRMICKYAFRKRGVRLFICWIGTHSDYNKLCDRYKQYYISEYYTTHMEPLKYKVIKTKKQYYEYCNLVEKLTFDKKEPTPEEEDLIDLLIVLIEKYDAEHSTLAEIDPVALLRLFMEDHKMRSVDLANLLGVSTSLVSDVLNYRRGFSKTMINKISERFKIDPKALMRPYRLNPPGSASAKAKKDPKAPKPGPVKKPAKAKKATAHK